MDPHEPRPTPLEIALYFLLLPLGVLIYAILALAISVAAGAPL